MSGKGRVCAYMSLKPPEVQLTVADEPVAVVRAFNCLVCFRSFGKARTTVAVKARKSESLEGCMMKIRKTGSIYEEN